MSYTPRPAPDGWLSIVEACRRLGIGDRAMRGMVHREEVSSQYLGGRYLILESDVVALLAPSKPAPVEAVTP